MRRFCQVSGGFWREKVKGRAWFWTLLLATAIILGVFANVTANRWSGWFFDALESKDGNSALIAIAVFPAIVLFAAGCGVTTLVSRETLQVHWRCWLTTRLIDLWIVNKRFYRLSQSGFEPANPEYRIADDVRWATEPLVDFAIGLLSAVITIVTFIGILWSIGGALKLDLGGGAITIPAYLVLAAILYAALVSLLMLYFGRPLPQRAAERSEAEARLRFGLMQVRENGEAIALGHGETGERQALAKTYDGLVLRWLAMVRRRGHLTWITNGNGTLVPVIPLLLATPKYLAGEMSLGGVVQVAAAFVQVQMAFNWVVENFMRIAEWIASARRVTDLVDAIEQLEDSTHAGGMALIRVTSPIGHLALRRLTLADREGHVLARDLDLTLAPGESVHVSGDMGLARSALVQAIAGLWPWGQGTLELPARARVGIAPPRLRLSHNRLRVVLESGLSGGADGFAHSDAMLRDTLVRYGLSELAGDLDAVRDWDRALSAGDRQKLAIARADLDGPDVMIFDETTNAFEADVALGLLQEFRQSNPDAIILMLGQGPGFAQMADRRIAVKRMGGIARFEPEPRLESIPGHVIGG